MVDYQDSLLCANFDFQMGRILLPNPLEWDLTWVSWIDPYGLVGLTCMLEELARSIPVASDSEALERALQRHVSGTGSPGRGQGLTEVAEYIQRLGGWVVVRSGEARRQLGPEFPETLQVVHFPGTFVGAWLPCG